MKEIADKLNSMDGVKVIGQMGNLDPAVFLGRYWIQFTCSNKESIDFILHACTGANVICKIEEGWGNADVPVETYVYTLVIQESRLEPFKGFMGMPYRVTGGIKPILAKDVKWIKDLMPQEEEKEELLCEQPVGSILPVTNVHQNLNLILVFVCIILVVALIAILFFV